MIRRFVAPVLAAVTLAGMAFLATPVQAQKQGEKARPDYLLCQVDDGKGHVFPIWIDWKKGRLQGAVDECLGHGGHPVGVE